MGNIGDITVCDCIVQDNTGSAAAGGRWLAPVGGAMTAKLRLPVSYIGCWLVAFVNLRRKLHCVVQHTPENLQLRNP